MIASATSHKKREHRWKKGDRLTSAWVQSVHNFVFGIAVVGGSLTWHRNKPTLNIYRKPPRPWEVKTRSSTSITIRGGRIIYGRASADITDTTLTVSGGTAAAPLYVYARFEWADFAGSIEIPTTPLASRPAPNDEYWQDALFAIYWDGLTHHITEQYRTNTIDAG